MVTLTNIHNEHYYYYADDVTLENGKYYTITVKMIQED